MSKGLGQRIAIKFTEEIVTMTETPIGGTAVTEGVWTLTGTTTGTEADLRDGNLTTYWRTATIGASVKVELSEPKVFKGVKYYTGSTYNTMNYNVKGSNDGTNFTNLFSSSRTATGYETKEFENNQAYKYYLFEVTSLSGRLYLYELAFMVLKNEPAFRITGKEYQYVGGPLIDKTYKVARVDKDQVDSKIIHLTLEQYYNRFNNVFGDLKVEYDAAIGDLRGRGGPVEGFTETFTPVDLEPKPNPRVTENIEVSAEANITFTKVTYNQAYADEQITVSATATVDFIYVGVINP